MAICGRDTHDEAGFTLVELLVAVLIMGALGATVVVATGGFKTTGALSACVSARSAYEDGFVAFRADHPESLYPVSDSQVVPAYAKRSGGATAAVSGSPEAASVKGKQWSFTITYGAETEPGSSGSISAPVFSDVTPSTCDTDAAAGGLVPTTTIDSGVSVALSGSGTDFTATLTNGPASVGYVFLSKPSDCDTCYRHYRATTSAATGTYAFSNVGPGPWQARYVSDASGTRTFYARSNNVTTTSWSDFPAPTVELDGTGTTYTVTLAGGPPFVGYIFLAKPNACDTCYSQYRPTTVSPTGTYTFTNVAPGAWQARYVTDADGTRTFLARSNDVATTTWADYATPSVTLAGTGTDFTATLTDGPPFAGYIFLAKPTDCDTCYRHYRATTASPTGTYTFTDVGPGPWQARYVTDADGNRTFFARSNDVSATTWADFPTPSVALSGTGSTYTATLTNGPAFAGYIFLAKPTDCDTCYTLYRATTASPTGTYTFTNVGPGAWQARYVSDADGTRTFLARSNDVAATTSWSDYATPVVHLTGTGTTYTATLASGPPFAGYIFLAKPTDCDTCHLHHLSTTSAAAGAFTFTNVGPGPWEARYVSDASGIRTFLARSNNVTTTSWSDFPAPVLTATATSGSVEVSLSNGPPFVGYIFLAQPTDCATCYTQYLPTSVSPSGTYTFTGVSSGAWEARYVSDASGVRTKLGSAAAVAVP